MIHYYKRLHLPFIIWFSIAIISGIALWIAVQGREIQRLETEHAVTIALEQCHRSIIRALDNASEQTKYIATAIGVGRKSPDEMKHILASHHHEGRHTEFSDEEFVWVGRDGQGYSPRENEEWDLSDRDYILRSQEEPLTLQFGGGKDAHSQRLPIAIGAVDSNGKYVGTVLNCLHLEGIEKKIKAIIGSNPWDYVVFDPSFHPVLSSLPVSITNDPSFIAAIHTHLQSPDNVHTTTSFRWKKYHVMIKHSQLYGISTTVLRHE